MTTEEHVAFAVAEVRETLMRLVASLPKCDACANLATRSVFDAGRYCDEHGKQWDPTMIHDLSYAQELRRILRPPVSPFEAALKRTWQRMRR